MAGLVAVFQHDLFKPRMLTQERVQELRAKYPVSYLVPPTVNIIELSFSDILDISPNAVVVAEVVKKVPEYRVMREVSFTPYQVKVEEIIIGKMDSEFINISYNSGFVGSEPDLQVGTKIVVAVVQAPSHPVGIYGFTKYGMYYVVDDHYVLSAYESKELGELGIEDQVMNGKTLTALKAAIRDYYNR